MSTTVKSLKVTYNPVNGKETFTNGDWVTGQVTLEVSKDCQIDSLFIKFKGKAEVLWTERHGKTTVVYHSKDKYFSLKHYFIRGKNLTGRSYFKKVLLFYRPTVYSFACNQFLMFLCFRDMPCSFTGCVGKIVYLLEAKLSRSMRIATTDSTKINFIIVLMNLVLQTPQHESKDKKLKIFTSGAVSMDVDIEKTGFFQGEGLKVLACIQNNSSREIKPKYCVYRKHSFFARGRRKVYTKDLLKEVGEPIPPSANTNVTRVITIPHDMEPSILNCNIIKVEYRLRVYLDVKYASDPEIKFPIIILPASQVPAVAPPPAAAAFSDFGFEPFGNTNPPAWGIAPPQPPAAPQPFDPPPPYATFFPPCPPGSPFSFPVAFPPVHWPLFCWLTSFVSLPLINNFALHPHLLAAFGSSLTRTVTSASCPQPQTCQHIIFFCLSFFRQLWFCPRTPCLPIQISDPFTVSYLFFFLWFHDELEQTGPYPLQT
uniref:Si:ch211-130m23.2 n=1 Tax=Seriola lalandi dorsalis TaxID=1841481 RepID=A0A3B4X0B2_SERLL